MSVSGSFVAGAAYKCLRCPAPDGSSQNAEDMRWSALADRWLVPVADQLLTHVARSVFVCLDLQQLNGHSLSMIQV